MDRKHDEKKRILYIEANQDGTIGGSYYSLLYLVQGLNKIKYEPFVMFCQDNVLIQEFRKVTPNVYIEEFPPAGSAPIRTLRDVIMWPYLFLVEIVFSQRKILRLIENIKPDLVHLNNGYAALHNWVLASRIRGIKVVAHDRGTRFPCSIRTKYFAKYLDAIVSVSECYKNNVVRQKLRTKLIRRVYNGLNVDVVLKKIDRAEQEKLRGGLGIEANQPVVGIVGNIDRWKGQLVVVEAISRVRKIIPNIKCLIVGPVCKGAEDYRIELDEYILENNLRENVIFTGFVRNIPNILGVMDVLCHASIEPEPFSRVILEGMAMGKPIVGTNSGGTPEQIVEGETGRLVPMNDPEGMAEAILYLLKNKKQAEEMGRKGRERLNQMFSISRMVKETETLYEDIFQEK
jgi:glycosyltransferase involved in cell wall biosynthesis